MNGVKNFGVMALTLLTVLAMGCSPGEPATEPEGPAAELATEAPEVYVVNYPLAYFAERIGGDAVSVVFPAPADADPGWWRPDDGVVLAYQEADLILLNGADFARWVRESSLPEAKTVNTSAAFADQYIEISDGVVHSHGPEGQHAHKGLAPNTWLDPTQAIQQAAAIRDAFSENWPEHEAQFEAGFGSLEAELGEVDAAWAALFAEHADVPVIASHPVYNYFARRYDLNLRNLHWEPSEMPEDEEWTALETLLAEHPAKFVMWELPPDAAIAERLAETGLESVVFYTNTNRIGDEDYFETMRANMERLEAALAE
jgi:zinc transport system substrate-binding protein